MKKLKNVFVFITVCVFSVCQLAAFAQESESFAPVLPDAIGGHAKKTYEFASNLVSQGNFADAKTALNAAPYNKTIPVFINASLVPLSARKDYIDAVLKGMNDWNAKLGGLITLTQAKDEASAKLTIQFETIVIRNAASANFNPNYLQLSESCGSFFFYDNLPSLEQVSKKRNLIRISIYVKGSTELQSVSQVTMFTAFEIGEYFGLYQPVQLSPSNTSPNTIINVTLPKPVSDEDYQAVTTAIKATNELMTSIEAGKAVKRRIAEIYVEQVDLDNGNVTAGEQTTYNFVIHNKGNATLDLQVRAACGCTATNYDKNIPPGGTGKLEAKLNTAGYQGKTRKTIFIYSNDPKTPEITLSVSANVIPGIAVVPQNPISINLQETGDTVYNFHVFSRMTAPLEIKRISAGDNRIKVDYKPWVGELEDPLVGEGLKTRTGYEVIVTIPASFPNGRASVNIVISGNDPKQSDMPIMLTMEKGIIVVPPTASLGVVSPAPKFPTERIITISKNSKAFNIISAVVEDESGVADKQVEVKLQTIREGHEYRIYLKYVGGWKYGQVKRTLKVVTDDPAQTILNIDIVASVQEVQAPVNN